MTCEVWYKTGQPFSKISAPQLLRIGIEGVLKIFPQWLTDWLTEWLTVSVLCREEGYTVKYSLSTREIPRVEGSFVVPLFGDQKSNVPHGFHNFTIGGDVGGSDPFWEQFHNLSVFLGWLSLVPPWALIKKNFINHSFCRNGAVRNPTGTRLDFLA